MMRYFICLLTVFPLFLAVAIAAPPDKVGRKMRSDLPITIKSNELRADNKGKTAIFSGKVIAKQGDVSLYADKIVISYGDQKTDVEKIEAFGNVRIVQQNNTGIADHAVYESREGRIVLTGNPKVMQGGNIITGNTITYYVDDDRSVVSGGSDRVVTIINPPARKGNADGR